METIDIPVREVYEIDVNGKYIMAINPISSAVLERVRKRLEEWLASDETFLLVNAEVIKLVKVHDTQDTSAPKPD